LYYIIVNAGSQPNVLFRVKKREGGINIANGFLNQ